MRNNAPRGNGALETPLNYAGICRIRWVFCAIAGQGRNVERIGDVRLGDGARAGSVLDTMNAATAARDGCSNPESIRANVIEAQPLQPATVLAVLPFCPPRRFPRRSVAPLTGLQRNRSHPTLPCFGANQTVFWRARLCDDVGQRSFGIVVPYGEAFVSAGLTPYQLRVLRSHKDHARRESEQSDRRAAQMVLSRLGYIELNDGVYRISPTGKSVLEHAK
jgi:hypothetical protein